MESKGLTADSNLLIRKDLFPIRWWAIVIFLVVFPLLLAPAVWLIRDRGMLAMLATFFATGLIALAVAMAPIGRAALPALGFRRAGWRPIVFGTVGALVVSVAVTQIGIEPQGIKQAMEVAREPAKFAASFAVMAGLAPLVEELIFRGLLYGWLAGRWFWEGQPLYQYLPGVREPTYPPFAAMVFQVIVPRQMRGFEIGRHRLEFVYQSPSVFGQVNQPNWLDSLKSDAGFAKVAGIELTLFDCARYFHKAAGINGLAQVVKDLGGQAKPDKLAKIAAHYENSSVRRLGYLLERMQHLRQADALRPFVRKAKTAVLLDPSVKALVEGLPGLHEKEPKWLLILNETVEVDS